jgi:AraC-like DNA-binding protein
LAGVQEAVLGTGLSTVSDGRWSSSGLSRTEALRQWRDWASGTLAPIQVKVPEIASFSARWTRQSVGPLQVVQMGASAQRVFHPEPGASAGPDQPGFQIVYARRSSLKTSVGAQRFIVRPGEMVLLDNARAYEMVMDDYHEAIDLIMPRDWLAGWIEDADALVGKPISATRGWGAPLGSLLETVAQHLDDANAPRGLIAQQFGALLALAGGHMAPVPERHRADLSRRILQLIADNHADPELTLDHAARTLSISRRHVQHLLARAGTSFVQALTATRLERAADMLADPCHNAMPIADIAQACGFQDAGYFTRLFRHRFAVPPRLWRHRRPD